MRIVVIDDDGRVAETVAAMLQPMGHDVEIATNARRGIELALTTSAECVITDILMPATDGVEVIRALRQRRPDLWIVAISGGSQLMSSSMSLDLARVMGADRVLYKPFNRSELLDAVDARHEE